MLETWLQLVGTSLAVASISWTVTKSKVFAPWRAMLARRSDWFYELFSCPYCFSHYLSFLAVMAVLYQPVVTPWVWLNLAISVFATVTLSSAFGGYFIRYAFQTGMGEVEQLQLMQDALIRAKETIERLEREKKELAAEVIDLDALATGKI